MLLAHLSDLHLRDEADAIELARQLDRIVARGAEHLVVTGDLLDRWQPHLLDRALDAMADRGLLRPDRITILHGNHDLASSGGHPRAPGDLRRLALRFWDPPPIVSARRRAFYRQIAQRAHGVAEAAPFLKPLPGGIALAVIDTVPAPWRPFTIRGHAVRLNHARGAITATQLSWLSQLTAQPTLIVLCHHYPLPVPPFEWRRPLSTSASPPWWQRWLDRWTVTVPMEIRAEDRHQFWVAARQAGVSAVLCGHVHRARVERHDNVAVALNGQSGAAWAGRTIAYYRVEKGLIRAEYETVDSRGHGGSGSTTGMRGTEGEGTEGGGTDGEGTEGGGTEGTVS